MKYTKELTSIPLKVSRLSKKYFFLILILASSNAIRANGIQNNKKKAPKITISLKDVNLEQVIYELEIYGKVKFSYNSRILLMKQKVSIKANNSSLSDVLIKLLKPYNITYSVVNDHIILQKITCR